MQLLRLHSYCPFDTSAAFALAIACAMVSSFSQEAGHADSGAISGTLTATKFGQDFTDYHWIVPTTNAEGNVALRTNRFTVLENNLNYFANGVWQKSDDVIEQFQNGAVARHGPNQAIFSSDLHAGAGFDILASDGKRIAGGVRAIQATDVATGKSVVLGIVRRSVPAQLLPPSQILYADAFDGIDADVLLTWKHNFFSHDILLKSQPKLVDGLDPTTTRLDILTEFVAAPVPILDQQSVKRTGQPDLVDDAVIQFGALAIVVGQCFPVNGQDAVDLGGFSRVDGAPPVLKQWSASPDGRAFLIESVAWSEVQAQLSELPVAQQANVKPVQERNRILSSRSWPERLISSAETGPVLLASAPFKPRGYALDFIMLPKSPLPTTFTADQTYWITNNYSWGGASVSFAPGCVIKYNANNWLMLYGQSITFPSTLQSVVLTSKDDNAFGEELPGSTGTPTQTAAQAIWIYYTSVNTLIDSARIRWAKRGIEYDQNPGVTATHTVRNCLFEQITGTGNCGVYVNIPSGSGVTLSGVQKYNVTTPVQTYAGSVSGTMTDALFHSGIAFRGIDNSDGYDPASTPDTMGAIGPTQFFEVLNGQVAAFGRTSGIRALSSPALNTFFQTSDTVGDPHVLFDHTANRWAVSAIDTTANNLLLRISLSSSCTPFDSSNWLPTYVIPISVGTGQGLDFDTLGMDANGLYASVQVRMSTVRYGYRIQAFHKPDVYSSGYTPAPILSVAPADLDTWCIQPAFNFDTPINGYAWFVAKGPSSGNNGGSIKYRRLQWSGNTVAWVDGSWRDQTINTDYYDIPQDASFPAPQSGGSVNLGETGSRLLMAVIRNGYLWTCHHVGLNAQGTYTGSTKDRSGLQWIQLQVGSGGLSWANQGRVYDVAASSPYWYYFPSLNINASGDMVIGFSGSKTAENVGAFFQARKANGTWTSQPVLVQGGRSTFHGSRGYGDYSATTMDPNDGTFWTVQEFASNDVPWSSAIWGTWVMQIIP
jgi:hypothetical protein